MEPAVSERAFDGIDQLGAVVERRADVIDIGCCGRPELGVGDGGGVLHERFCLPGRYDEWCGNGADLITLRIDDLLSQREMHDGAAAVGDLTMEGRLRGFHSYLGSRPVHLRYVNGIRDDQRDASVDASVKVIVCFDGGRRRRIEKVIDFDGQHILSVKAWMDFERKGCVSPFVSAQVRAVEPYFRLLAHPLELKHDASCGIL